MIRTQVYLTAEQHAALQRESRRLGISLTEQLRRLLDRYLLAKSADPALEREPYFSFVGIGDCGSSDVAERHDDYLAEAYPRADVR